MKLHAAARWLPICLLLLTSLGTPLAHGQDDPPKGEVLKRSFSESQIFPGTYRDYWIYVPRQYDPAKPACVYVNQDGIQYNAPQVFDRLIASGDMPVTIGVFVMHGRVKADNPEQALDRFNRSYEYDGLGDSYARFLLEELLPEVEKQKTEDGRVIKLSQRGTDRAIGGASSGAICAFTAAWERPDAFQRVFSSIGTYVGLRGGNAYPTLIRKYEPRPIRVFLEDGSNDQNIYGGDWWMANLEMERALKFAGYEVEHSWSEGGHDIKHATEIFPDAMKWLWKGWPESPKAGKGAPQLQDIVTAGEGWNVVAEKRLRPRHPVTDLAGAVYFLEDDEGSRQDRAERLTWGPPATLRKWFVGGETSALRTGLKGARCLAMGLEERVYASVSGAEGPTVMGVKPGGAGEREMAALQARSLVVKQDGRAYALAFDPESEAHDETIFLLSPDGSRRVAGVYPDFQPGALCLSPDQTLLYVAHQGSHWVHSFQIAPDGTLRHGQKYYHLHLPDTRTLDEIRDLKVDTDGRLYCATSLGIQVCDQAGRVNCIIPVPGGAVTGLCFAGPDAQTLVAFTQDRILTRRVKTRGANPLAKPNKPGAPRL
jgi:enterochelin esterase-like enzyme